MNDQLELRLRRDLSAMDRAPLGDAIRIERAIDEAIDRRRRRRRTRLVGVSGALVIGGGLAIWSLGDRPDEVSTADSVASSVPVMLVPSPTTTPASPTPSTVAPDSTDGWAPIAADPRGPVLSASAVWADGVAIVFGGQHPDGYAVGGAVGYSPALDSWDTYADPPASLGSDDRVSVLTVWTGHEVLVVGGESTDGSTTYADAAAFDPSANAWRMIAAPPRPLSARAPWTWTGSELFVWPLDVSGATSALAYAPATDSWRELPVPPLVPRGRSASVWTGAEWLVWGGSAGGDDFGDGAAFDPVTGTWRAMAAAPLSPRRANAAWTGTEMIVAAGSSGGDPTTGNGEMAHGDGAAYDPQTDTWRSIASGPAHPGFEPVWIGTELLLFAKGGVVLYDPSADEWTDECCGNSPAMTSSTPLWTGTQVLLIGSIDPSIGGASYTPSSSDDGATTAPSTTAPSAVPSDQPDALTAALAELGVDVAAAPDPAVTLDGALLCGVESLDLERLLAADGLDEASRRCFLDRHISGQPAVFVEARPTTEGDPIVTVWRSRADGTIEQHVDFTRDSFGSGTWESRTCGRLTTAFGQSPEPVPATTFACDVASVDAAGRLTLPSATVPSWFERRQALPLCGYEVRISDRNVDGRSCFADAVRSGAAAEYVRVSTGDEGDRVASWFRSLGDGEFEVVEWTSGLVMGMVAEPSEWRRWACTTIVLASDPGGEMDGLPLVNDAGECTLVESPAA